MDQEKMKKIIIAVWVISLFAFTGYIVRLYAKSIDIPTYSQVESQDIGTEVEGFVDEIFIIEE